MVAAPSTVFLIDLARRAGRFAMGIFVDKELHDTQWKPDNTPFSAADTGVHDIIVAAMQAAYPEIPIVGEEGDHGTRIGGENEFWLSVDEIDGSTAFIMGISTFVIMITLMRGILPVRCVIHDPVLGRTYCAELGRGAFLNGKPIRVAKTFPKNPMVGICAWPDRGKHDMLIPGMVSSITVKLHERGFTFTNCCSIGYFDALVASGQLAATIFAGEHPHDTAAGDLLVREAGGVATDLLGNPLLYGRSTVAGHLFSSPGTYREVRELVDEAVRESPDRIRNILAPYM